ncbi:hypothetical protein SAMN03159288_05294 [Rhizobium sp. NFACC06-2]|nr:hypothetical protein SAMN03159288_05294 [Rhizobium sp. NFACC06-2]
MNVSGWVRISLRETFPVVPSLKTIELPFVQFKIGHRLRQDDSETISQLFYAAALRKQALRNTSAMLDRAGHADKR